MRWAEIINETSSAGATAAGNIASVSSGTGQGAIGVGFDPDGDHGVYQQAKKKKKKNESPTDAAVLRR